MPEDVLGALDDDLISDLVQEEESGGKGAGGLVTLLMQWHPILLLVASMGAALAAWIMLPEEVQQTMPTLDALYKRGHTALLQVDDPLYNLDEGKIQENVITAKTTFDLLFSHPAYADDILERPELINPSMLYADALRLYASYRSLESRELLQRSIIYYNQALTWMDTEWPEADAKIYRQQFQSPNSERFDQEAYAIRRRRRRQYIQYQLAKSMIGTNDLRGARKVFEELLTSFRITELADDARTKQAAALRDSETANVYLPRPFEIMPEEKNLVYFHLAQILESQGALEEAENDYRIFLLNAPRSIQRFQALNRLGEIYLAKAYASIDEDPLLARRMFSAAAEHFEEVVNASAPERMLQKAYFDGGRAMIGIAETIPHGKQTIWDQAAKSTNALEGILESFAGNAPLPERTRYAPAAIGRQLLYSGFDVPDPIGTPLLAGTGLPLTLLTKERWTLSAQRAGYLKQARQYLKSAAVGPDEQYEWSAQVLTARTYMINGDFDKARAEFNQTKSNYYTPGEAVGMPGINEACQLGIIESYLIEGKRDRARVRFLGGVEKIGGDGLPASSLLKENDISSGWVEICHLLSKAESAPEGQDIQRKRVWEFLPAHIRKIISQISTTSRIPQQYQRVLLAAMNDLLDKEAFYDATVFPPNALPDQANILLQTPMVLLTPNERRWLNRMLLDECFSTQIVPTDKGQILPAFPGQAQLPVSPLIRPKRVEKDLEELALAYSRHADESIRRNAEQLDPISREAAAKPRRSLLDASEVYEYLLTEHNPHSGALIERLASIYHDRAQLAADWPFLNEPRAIDLLAKSARTYLQAAESSNDLILEPEAYFKAGEFFFGARQYGRASEAFTTFANLYPNSDKLGRAQNLLGLAFENIGDYANAQKIFTDNSTPKIIGEPKPGDQPTRTNEQWKAMYYLGAVLMKTPDTIGSMDAPFPPEVNDVSRVRSSLQAFNYIRQANGITPLARPWQWATFGLGQTLYKIAERTRAESKPTDREPTSVDAVQWLPVYKEAEAVLREGLERYRLKEDPDSDIGIDPRTQPEEYRQVRWQRLRSQYTLARTLREISRWRESRDEEEVRSLLREVIDPNQYPDTMFAPPEGEVILADRPILGINEGPEPNYELLRTLQRNAYFLLGHSLYEEGQILADKGKRRQSMAAYEEALRVYQLADANLSADEDPAIFFYTAETLSQLGRTLEAEKRYEMVINEATRQIKNAPDGNDPENERWVKLATGRLSDSKFVENK